MNFYEEDMPEHDFNEDYHQILPSPKEGRNLLVPDSSDVPHSHML